MGDHSLYTTQDLVRLAEDRGPFFDGKARQALRWASQVLVAANAAVQAERLRAEAAEARLREIVSCGGRGAAAALEDR